MRESGSPSVNATAVREVAYPVEHVWRAMATLLPYCSVCQVSAIVDSDGELGLGSEFRAFPGRLPDQPQNAAGREVSDSRGGGVGPVGGAGAQDVAGPARGMAGKIVDWSPQRSVATRLEASTETVVVAVEMAAASRDTTLVTISVEVTPRMRNRLAMAMTRTSYARMATRTVQGEIDKLPAHLALAEEREI